MGLIKYNISWIGIDGGREGLWKEPIWMDVLRMIGKHEKEQVYDPNSAIYVDLERAYPIESWRSKTVAGVFRPLFRDYSHPWTRTGVVSLDGQRFRLTEMGTSVLGGILSKAEVLIRMFKSHFENSGAQEQLENPFGILSAGIIEANRALSTKEIYWAIMKNYRSNEADDLAEILKKKLPFIKGNPDPTPYRRLRSMLTLLRTANAISSTRRQSGTFWMPLDKNILSELGSKLKP